MSDWDIEGYATYAGLTVGMRLRCGGYSTEVQRDAMTRILQDGLRQGLEVISDFEYGDDDVEVETEDAADGDD